MTRHRGSHTPPVAPPEELPEPVMAVPVLAPGLWFWDGELLVPDKDIPDARPEDVPVPADIPVPPPLARYRHPHFRRHRLPGPKLVLPMRRQRRRCKMQNWHDPVLSCYSETNAIIGDGFLPELSG
jgi:hypothetical protein